jgi:hypothetical protein
MGNFASEAKPQPKQNAQGIGDCRFIVVGLRCGLEHGHPQRASVFKNLREGNALGG